MNLLNEASNGALPDSDLVPIEKGKLQKNAGEAYTRMKNDAKKEGVNIKLTGPNSGYRECGEPGDYTEGKSGGKFTQWYAWELYKAGKGHLAANPTGGKCTSNHGWGRAIDVSGSKAKKWVRKNGDKYGWCWGEAKNEDWHFTYCGEGPNKSSRCSTICKSPIETNKTKDQSLTKQSQPIPSFKIPVILMGGRNDRPGDKSTKEQGDLVSSGLGGITDVIAKDYTDLSGVKKEIDKSPNSPIVLFSAGGSKAKQISKYVIEKGGSPTNIFISEPYTIKREVLDNVKAAIANGVPKENIIGGPDESNSTGKNVAGVSRKELGGKSHWDGLKVAGQLIKNKFGNLLTKGNNDSSSDSSSDVTTTSEPDTSKYKYGKKLYNIFGSLEEGPINEEVDRINDLIKKIL